MSRSSVSSYAKPSDEIENVDDVRAVENRIINSQFAVQVIKAPDEGTVGVGGAGEGDGVARERRGVGRRDGEDCVRDADESQEKNATN